ELHPRFPVLQTSALLTWLPGDLVETWGIVGFAFPKGTPVLQPSICGFRSSQLQLRPHERG
ncbi:MAG: hypothetical protein AAGG53_13760, partial [Cyanobacteria bacterium P01_H01_bin.152]